MPWAPLNTYEQACASLGESKRPEQASGGWYRHRGRTHLPLDEGKEAPPLLPAASLILNENLPMFGEESNFCHSQGTHRYPILLWEGK